MMLRIKVWPSETLAKQVFVTDSKVIEFRTAHLDLRTFPAVAQLTDFARSLLWEDFFRDDSRAWERRGEITSANIEAFTEDTAVLHEWVSHLFKEKIAELNDQWTAAHQVASPEVKPSVADPDEDAL